MLRSDGPMIKSQMFKSILKSSDHSISRFIDLHHLAVLRESTYFLTAIRKSAP
jgi:hypothetical protein